MRGLVRASQAVVGVLLSTLSAQAQEHCTDYANEMVALHVRAPQEFSRCPNWRSHGRWQEHYDWCTRTPRQVVQSVREEWGARFDGCAASYGRAGGGAAAPRAPSPPCNGLGGRYGGATITVSGGNRVIVDMGPSRLVASGTCNGNRLTVNFPDDRTHTGTFDGRTIFWSNNTRWNKN